MFYIISLACVCIYISVLDIHSRRITNISVFSLLLLQCALLIESDVFLASGLVVFLTGLFLFWQRWVGAGDIKYASVLAVALPVSQVPLALMLTGLVGGLVSLCYLLLNYWFPNRKQRQAGIPYGLAISAGFGLVIVAYQAPLLIKA
jgi:prepilin peptidase CpaA